MKKAAVVLLVVICLVGVFLYAWWGVIFQRGNPIPYLMAASKISEENPYVEVQKNIFISKRGECPQLFEDFQKSLGVTYAEQAGSGFIFTDGVKNYTISSEIYWGRYTLWTLPAME